MKSVATPILVCTPEIVGTWLFYPAWLCMPGVLPRAVVLDSSDFLRAHADAKSIMATPYDVLAWHSLETYRQRGFLLIGNPRYLGTSVGEIRTSYSHLVGQRLPEIHQIARSIVNQCGKEQLHQIVRHGYYCWLQFGLQLKRQFKGKDPIFAKAVEETQKAILAIERQVFPIDPARLLKRYLVKILVGLYVADTFADKLGISKSSVRVFDTPEYAPAADLIVRHRGIDADRFAIPSQSPADNEDVIREVLGLDYSQEPLLYPDLELLVSAVEEIRLKLAAGESQQLIKHQISSQLEIARQEFAKKDALYATKSLLVGGVASALGVTAAFISRSVCGHADYSLSAGVPALVSVLVNTLQARDSLKHLKTTSSKTVQFLITREKFHGFNPVFNACATWQDLLVKLARTFTSREPTKDRLTRQMMEPWLDNPVWYDPNRIRKA